MDALIFVPDPIPATNMEENMTLGREQSSLSQVKKGEEGGDIIDEEVEVEPDAENIERPVDLYKVCSSFIFIMSRMLYRYINFFRLTDVLFVFAFCFHCFVIF